MTVTGLYLKGLDARIITLQGTAESHKLIAEKTKKITLPKNPTQDDVKKYISTLQKHIEKHKVEKLIMNRRAMAGQGAGGPGTFLQEGIILSVSPVPVEFVHPATVRATDRKMPELKSQKPKTVDMSKAYDFAFEGLRG